MPGAVAGVRVSALGAAVLEVLERVERLLDDGMGRLAPELRDERDAARVVLVGGVVEASGPGGSSIRVHKGRSGALHWTGRALGGGATAQRRLSKIISVLATGPGSDWSPRAD